MPGAVSNAMAMATALMVWESAFIRCFLHVLWRCGVALQDYLSSPSAAFPGGSAALSVNLQRTDSWRIHSAQAAEEFGAARRDVGDDIDVVAIIGGVEDHAVDGGCPHRAPPPRGWSTGRSGPCRCWIAP